jgi:hypothetical protein
MTGDTAHKSTLLRVWNNEGSHFIVVNAARASRPIPPSSPTPDGLLSNIQNTK